LQPHLWWAPGYLIQNPNMLPWLLLKNLQEEGSISPWRRHHQIAKETKQDDNVKAGWYCNDDEFDHHKLFWRSEQPEYKILWRIPADKDSIPFDEEKGDADSMTVLHLSSSSIYSILFFSIFVHLITAYIIIIIIVATSKCRSSSAVLRIIVNSSFLPLLLLV